MITSVIHRGSDVIIRLSDTAMALASTVDGGLRNSIRYVIHHQVPKDFNKDPLMEVMEVHKRHAMNTNETITFLTATELPRNHTIHRETMGQVETWVSITMGLSNPYKMSNGDLTYSPAAPSTINTAIIINKALTIQAMIDVITLTAQVKALTLDRLVGIHGTTSDAIAVIVPTNDEPEPYAGPATTVGRTIVRAVYNTLIMAYNKYLNKE